MSDLISRQAAMEMLMVQNVIMDGSEYHNGFNAGVNRAQEVIRNLSPVQQEITHEQAIDYLNKTGWMQTHDRILTESKIVPPVQPQQMKGRWLPDNNCAYEMRFVCSVCKESEVVPTIGFTKYKPIWDFCPNCGAKMEG